jgi:hypothetical protein
MTCRATATIVAGAVWSCPRGQVLSWERILLLAFNNSIVGKGIEQDNAWELSFQGAKIAV